MSSKLETEAFQAAMAQPTSEETGRREREASRFVASDDRSEAYPFS